MVEKPTELPVVYLKNKRGTVVKETDPNEIARLQRETSYEVIPPEEGQAAFAGKRRAFEKLDKTFGGELSKAAEATAAS